MKRCLLLEYKNIESMKSGKRDTSMDSSARFLASMEAKKRRSEISRERSCIRAAEIRPLIKRQPIIRYYQDPRDILKKSMKNLGNCLSEIAALIITEDREWRSKYAWKKDKTE